MVYFIFGQAVLYSSLSWALKSVIILVILFFVPPKAKKQMLIALIFIILVSAISGSHATFNTYIPNEGAIGFIYKISDNKADCYIDGNKFKLKSKELSQCQDGDAVTLNDIELRQQDTHNVHGYDYEQHYQFKGYISYIGAKLKLAHPEAKDIWYRRLFSVIRRHFVKSFDTYSPRVGGLARALVLGDLGDKKLTQMISSLGVIHLFVISGFHFNVISSLIFGVLHKVLKCPYKFSQFLLCLSLILYYCVIFGGYGSQRALFMTVFGFMAFLLNRRKDAVQLTLFYAACSLYLNPLCYTELGFILTNMTVIVVSVVSRALKRAKLTKTQQNLVISVAVFIVISSIIIYQNGSMSFVSILLVPLLTPVISVFIVAVMLNIAFSFVVDIPFYLDGLNWLAGIICGWIERAYQLKFLTLSLHPHVALTAAVFMCLYFGFWLMRNHGISKLNSLAMSAFISLMIIISTFNTGANIKSYALYDGEAYLVRSPMATIIYDVGNDPDIITYLKKDGVDVIDLLVISHGDQDHIGMLNQVMNNFDVKEVMLKIESKATRRIGDFDLKFFQRDIAGESAKNDSSISMLLTYNNHTMLFTGDLEQAGGLALLEDFKEHIDILKVPHHGSYNPVFGKMLKIYTPEYCFISGGKGKRINKSKVYKTLTSHDVPFYDTMVDGEVTIELGGDKIEFITYHERRAHGLRFILSGH